MKIEKKESEMSEAPTPETDAFAKAMYSTGVDCHHDGREALKHAERLERERDEAIRQRDETNESSVFSCNFYYEEKLKAERERDEAREEANKLSGAYEDATKYYEHMIELKEQLDQAMEIAEDFCGLVCYGMGWSGKDWSVENMRDARRTINWFHRLQEAVTK